MTIQNSTYKFPNKNGQQIPEEITPKEFKLDKEF